MLGTGGNTLSPRELAPLLIRLYNTQNKYSILLIGSHGVGKSTIVRDVAMQLAKSEGKTFVEISRLTTRSAKTDTKAQILDTDVYNHPEKYFLFYDLRLTELEPQDLMGLPRIDRNPVPAVGIGSVSTYAPPLWAIILSIPNIEGILFLDEITNIQRMDLISAAYKLLLDKSSGNLKFSNNVMVISAGNPAPQSGYNRSAAANPLPAPLLNRVIVLGVSPPTLEEWKQYMDTTYWDKKTGKRTWDISVYQFLLNHKENIWGDTSVTNRNYETYENEPTPRTYTNLALISEKLRDNPEQLRSAAIGLLGSVVGDAYYHFVTETTKNLTAEQLLQNPQLFTKIADLQRQDIVEIAHSIATGYTTDTRRANNLFITILKNVPNLPAAQAENMKDFLLTIFNSLSATERPKLTKEIAINGLLPIWNSIIR